MTALVFHNILLAQLTPPARMYKITVQPITVMWVGGVHLLLAGPMNLERAYTGLQLGLVLVTAQEAVLLVAAQILRQAPLLAPRLAVILPVAAQALALASQHGIPAQSIQAETKLNTKVHFIKRIGGLKGITQPKTPAHGKFGRIKVLAEPALLPQVPAPAAHLVVALLPQQAPAVHLVLALLPQALAQAVRVAEWRQAEVTTSPVTHL